MHRLYSAYDTTSDIKASRRKVPKTCRLRWGPKYTANKTEHCDECPFATTYENSARVDTQTVYDYAVRAIDKNHIVQEVSMLRSPLALPDPTGDWIAVGGPGGILPHSAATDHYPTVRLELWDDIPPATPTGWDHVLELTCDVNSAVRLQSVTATHSTHTLPIVRPCAHHVRVHGGNQDEATELDEGTLESGVERWLIQLWQA